MRNYKSGGLLFFLFRLVFSFQTSAQILSESKTELINDDVLVLQSFGDAFFTKTGDNIFKVTGNVLNHSTAIPFSFTKTILQNGFIDDDLKNSSSKRLKKFNYYEFGFDAGVSWYHYWSDSSFFRKCVTGVSLRERSSAQLQFTKDAFNTVFFGNAMYADDTAKFGGTRFQNIHYRQLQFSWMKQFGAADSSWSLYLGASLLQGMNANYAIVGAGDLFTEENGEYIDLNSAFIYRQSDTLASSLLNFKGTGVSADLVLSFPIGKDGNFKFFVKDAGFISWNNKSLLYVQDSLIHFEGIEVRNLFSFQDTSFLNINTDSILKMTGVTASQKSFTTRLPVSMGMIYSTYIMQRNAQLRIGFQYTPAFNLVPRVFVSFSSFKPKFIYPSVMVSMGGVQRFNAGAALSKVVADKLFISVGSESLLGIIIPDSFGSASAFARVSVRL